MRDLENYFTYLDSLGPRVWFFTMPHSNVLRRNVTRPIEVLAQGMSFQLQKITYDSVGTATEVFWMCSGVKGKVLSSLSREPRKVS
jgi:hypothetical protein